MLRGSRTTFWKVEILTMSRGSRPCIYECVKILNLHIKMHEVLFFCCESAWINAWNCIFLSFTWDSISYFCFLFEWVHEWMLETQFLIFAFCLNEFMNECMRLYSLLLLQWKCMYECMRFLLSFLNENEILFFSFFECM